MLREFTDTSGTAWKVWDVYPSSRMSQTLASDNSGRNNNPFPSPDLSEGWLCFESKRERRRFAPVPPGWEHWDNTALEELCARAPWIKPAASLEDGSDAVSPG
jgi:hypothetical protein